MSYKDILKEHNEELSSNNLDLQSILDNLNNLPDALIVNGVIDEYKIHAGNNINAGDFVQFCNEFGEVWSGATADGDCQFSAVALGDGRVFIVYGNSSEYVYGQLVRVTETEVTTLTNKSIYSSTTGAARSCKVVKLSSNKVLVIHGYSNAFAQVRAVVVSISDSDTLSIGTSYTVDSNSKAYAIEAVALNENKVFLAFGRTHYI